MITMNMIIVIIIRIGEEGKSNNKNNNCDHYKNGTHSSCYDYDDSDC
jgi:hypothetical protein